MFEFQFKLEFKRHCQSNLNGAHSPHSTRSTCQGFHLDNVRDDENDQVDNNDENYYNDTDECAGVSQVL